MSALKVPKVSIGIPVFNGENYLVDALESALAQTYTDLEVVISDNASTDSTRQICQQYLTRDPRIRYFSNEKNHGASYNFNRAFQLARGEYFKWLAHDDIMDPEFIEKCVDALDSNEDAVLACPFTVFVDASGKRRLRTVDQSPRVGSVHVHQRFSDLLYHSARHHVFGLIRSSVLAQTQLMRNYTDADGNLVAELGLRGVFIDVPHVLNFLREHDGRSTRAHRHFQKRDAWFDSQKSNKIVFPAWRAIWDYHRSLLAVPLSFKHRALGYLALGRWAATDRLRILGGQVKQNLQRAIGPDDRRQMSEREQHQGNEKLAQ